MKVNAIEKSYVNYMKKSDGNAMKKIYVDALKKTDINGIKKFILMLGRKVNVYS